MLEKGSFLFLSYFIRSMLIRPIGDSDGMRKVVIPLESARGQALSKKNKCYFLDKHQIRGHIQFQCTLGEIEI